MVVLNAYKSDNFSTFVYYTYRKFMECDASDMFNIVSITFEAIRFESITVYTRDEKKCLLKYVPEKHNQKRPVDVFVYKYDKNRISSKQPLIIKINLGKNPKYFKYSTLFESKNPLIVKKDDVTELEKNLVDVLISENDKLNNTRTIIIERRGSYNSVKVEQKKLDQYRAEIHRTDKFLIQNIVFKNNLFKSVPDENVKDTFKYELNQYFEEVRVYFKNSGTYYETPLLVEFYKPEKSYFFIRRNTQEKIWTQIEIPVSNDNYIIKLLNVTELCLDNEIIVRLDRREDYSDNNIYKNTSTGSLQKDENKKLAVEKSEGNNLCVEHYKAFKHNLEKYYNDHIKLLIDNFKSDITNKLIVYLELNLKIDNRTISLYDKNDDNQPLKLFYQTSKQSHFYVYFYDSTGSGENPDTFPLLCCYNNEWFRPYSRDKYFEKWIKVVELNLIIRVENSDASAIEQIKNQLDHVNGMLNQIDIEQFNEDYGVPKSSKLPRVFNKNRVILTRFNSNKRLENRSNDTASLENDSFNYTFITHKTYNNAPLSQIKFFGKEVDFIENIPENENEKRIEFKQDYNNVTVYYHKCDRAFHNPLLIELGYKNGSISARKDQFYELVNSNTPLKFRKLNLTLSHGNEIYRKINEINYNINPCVKINLELRSDDNKPLKYPVELIDVNNIILNRVESKQPLQLNKREQDEESKQPQVSEATEQPELDEITVSQSSDIKNDNNVTFKKYTHNIPSKDGKVANNYIGGLKFFIFSKRIQLYTESQFELSLMGPTYYTVCNSTVDVYFYKDIRPLLFCYDGQFYKPSSLGEYESKWVKTNLNFSSDFELVKSLTKIYTRVNKKIIFKKDGTGLTNTDITELKNQTLSEHDSFVRDIFSPRIDKLNLSRQSHVLYKSNLIKQEGAGSKINDSFLDVLDNEFIDQITVFYTKDRSTALLVELNDENRKTHFQRRDFDGQYWAKETAKYTNDQELVSILNNINSEHKTKISYLLDKITDYGDSVTVSKKETLEKSSEFYKFTHTPKEENLTKQSLVTYNGNLLGSDSSPESNETLNKVQNQIYSKISVYYGNRPKIDGKNVPAIIELERNDPLTGTSKTFYANRRGGHEQYWRKIKIKQPDPDDINLISELKRVEFDLVDSLVFLIWKQTDYDNHDIKESINKLDPKREINTTKINSKISVSDKTNDTEGGSIGVYEYKIFEHDVAHCILDESNTCGFRFIIPTNTSSKYHEITLYNDSYYNNSSGNYNHNNNSSNEVDILYHKPDQKKLYVYFYGDDPRPLLFCYNGNGYMPRNLSTYYEGWVKASGLEKCNCSSISDPNPEILKILLQVSNSLNPVNIKRTTVPGFSMHTFNDKDIKITVEKDTHLNTQESFCYDKYTFKPQQGHRLGNIMYSIDYIEDLDKSGQCITSTTHDVPYSSASEVIVYYYSHDEKFKNPLLIALRNKAYDTQSNYNHYYELQKSTVSIGASEPKRYKKGIDKIDPQNTKELCEKLNSILYGISDSLQIILSEQKNYKTKLYDNVKLPDSASAHYFPGSIEVSQEKTCLSLSNGQFKCSKHKVSNLSGLDEVGGLKFILWEGGPEVSLYLSEQSIKNEKEHQVVYTKCKGDILVYFYNKDPRPLILCFNGSAYRPVNKDSYDKTWLLDDTVTNYMCDSDQNVELLKTLTFVVKFLNTVQLEQHPGDGATSIIYNVHTFNSKNIQVNVTSETLKQSNTGCYTKLVHRPNGIETEDANGFRLGTIIYGTKQPNKQTFELEYASGDYNYYPLVSVTTYYYNYDKEYNDPLLVELEFIKADSKTDKEYHRLVKRVSSNINNSIEWQKEKRNHEVVNNVINYLNEVRYDLKSLLQIQLQHNSQLRYDLKLSQPGNKHIFELQFQKYIEVEEAVFTEIEQSGYKVFKHKISSICYEDHYNIGGVKLCIPGKDGRDMNIPLYDEQGTNEINKLFYNVCMDDFYVCFYGLDPRPLLLCYNQHAYRPQTISDYYKRWVLIKNVKSFNFSEGFNQGLLESLRLVSMFMNPVRIHEHTHKGVTNINYQIQKYNREGICIKLEAEDLKCYRKYTHTPNEGYLLGNIDIGKIDESQVSVAYNSNKTLIQATVYYYLYDIGHKYPLLVQLTFNDAYSDDTEVFYKIHRKSIPSNVDDVKPMIKKHPEIFSELMGLSEVKKLVSDYSHIANQIGYSNLLNTETFKSLWNYIKGIDGVKKILSKYLYEYSLVSDRADLELIKVHLEKVLFRVRAEAGLEYTAHPDFLIIVDDSGCREDEFDWIPVASGLGAVTVTGFGSGYVWYNIYGTSILSVIF